MTEENLTDREVLDVFVESVDELLQSDFLTQAKADGVSIQMRWSQKSGLLAERTGPKREAVKAFLLTLRFFRQNNEPTSLCNMEERINGLNVDTSLKERFRTARRELNSFLDRHPSVGFSTGTGADTRRQIFEAFLYGTFAHANPRYRRRIKVWENQPYFFDLQAQFDLILLEFLKAISTMANVCRECQKSVAVSLD